MTIAQPPIFKTMNQSNPRLWELSDEIQDLENAIANLVDDETLTESDRETKLQETFARWLSKGESFKVKAEQVARYISHQEALAEARKIEARRIQTLAKQAENSAGRLRKYLLDQMIRSDVQKIDGVSTRRLLSGQGSSQRSPSDTPIQNRACGFRRTRLPLAFRYFIFCSINHNHRFDAVLVIKNYLFPYSDFRAVRQHISDITSILVRHYLLVQVKH
jgi:hypothetical protein